MRYLLDTHVFIWGITGDPRLSKLAHSVFDEMRNAFRLETLPLHHRDPFDRMLIAQSLEERIPLVSGDAAFRSYPVELVW